MLTKTATHQHPIFTIFMFWYVMDKPDLIKNDKNDEINIMREQIWSNSLISGYDISSKHDCYEVISYCIEHKICSFKDFVKWHF